MEYEVDECADQEILLEEFDRDEEEELSFKRTYITGINAFYQKKIEEMESDYAATVLDFDPRRTYF
jgi:hypothetical protein